MIDKDLDIVKDLDISKYLDNGKDLIIVNDMRRSGSTQLLCLLVWLVCY